MLELALNCYQKYLQNYIGYIILYIYSTTGVIPSHKDNTFDFILIKLKCDLICSKNKIIAKID